MQILELLFISSASLLAGLIDSIVGGGGLVLVPALFAAFPTAAPATLLGTNKSASIWGTGIATWQYSKRVHLRWRALAPAALAGFLASLAGAWLITILSPDILRKALPVVLTLVLLYTLAKKEMGQVHQPRLSGAQESMSLCAIAILIGFYDGFFGPGTGSFLVFLLVRLLGYDFLHASAHAKLINTATNLAAVILFAFKGHVWLQLALLMAVSNIVGSLIGTHLVLKHGTALVRKAFIAVVSLLILKTSADALRLWA